MTPEATLLADAAYTAGLITGRLLVFAIFIAIIVGVILLVVRIKRKRAQKAARNYQQVGELPFSRK